MRKAIVLFFALICCLTFSSAQQTKPAALDKWEVFGGYSYSRAYAGINEATISISILARQLSLPATPTMWSTGLSIRRVTSRVHPRDLVSGTDDISG